VLLMTVEYRSLARQTVYLMYCLVNRLVRKKPTVLATTPFDRYLFLDSGVYVAPYAIFELWQSRGVREATMDLYSSTSMIDKVSWKFYLEGIGSFVARTRTDTWMGKGDWLSHKYYMKTWSYCT
jgi:hypothetical protein